MIIGKVDCLEDAFLSVTENAVLKKYSALVRPFLRSCNSDVFPSNNLCNSFLLQSLYK